MIKVLLLSFNVKNLKRQVRNIKTLRLSKFIVNLFFIISVTSCSQVDTKTKDPEYNSPPDNPFPSVLILRRYEGQSIGFTAKLRPETIKMSCRLRNDSPYYWCDFEGELTNPDPRLPTKISSTFHVVVAEIGKEAALDFAKRIKENNEPVTLVLNIGPFIAKIDYTIYSQLLGVYNSKECFDVFHDYSLCPKSAKKLDIFTGKFTE